jgi:integrase
MSSPKSGAKCGKEWWKEMPKLTARKVENAKAGRYTDGDGLMLYVAPSGRGSWVLRVQVSGRRREIGLGSVTYNDGFCDMSEVPLLERRVLTLADARLKAAILRQMAKAGRDPVIEQKRDRVPNRTFADAMQKAYEAKLPEWSERTAKSFLSAMEQHALPQLGNCLIDAIDAAAIAQALSKIWTTRPPMARKVRQWIGLVLNFAEAQKWRRSSMPNDAVSLLLPKQPEGGHFEAMPYQEVPFLVRRLCEGRSVGRLGLLFLVLTAARSGEVRGAAWNQIDWHNRLWIRPAGLMKGRNAKQHIVTLNAEALNILNAAKHFRRADTDLVFPSQRGGTLSDMTLSSFLNENDGTAHGFRSSFRDWAAEQMPHVPDPVAEAALSHKVDNKVVAAYKRTNFLEMRHLLLGEWGKFCASQCCDGRLPIQHLSELSINPVDV